MTGIKFDVELNSTYLANSGDLKTDLAELLGDMTPILKTRRTCLAIFIYELQDLDICVLEALLVAQQKFNQEDWPLVIIGAGLPSLPGRLAEVVSYSERLFEPRRIGALFP